jgi:hypothetical protein
MEFFKRLFSLDTIILIFAIASIPFAVRQFIEVSDDFAQLNLHGGIIQAKASTIDSSKKVQRRIIRLKILNDTTTYSISRYVDKVNNLIEVNDSVQLYTKGITSKFGNFIIDEHGNGWNTRDENEVFHLTSTKYTDPIIDFEENKTKHRKIIWIWPIMSLLFFVWYFYRRFGFKIPVIVEN